MGQAGCPALRSCFAVSGRSPLSPLDDIELLFDRIAEWLDKEIGLSLPPEWGNGWPADIEKPRRFGGRHSLGFLIEHPDVSKPPRQFVLRLDTGRFRADFAVASHPDSDDMYLVNVEVAVAAAGPPDSNLLRLPSPVARLIEDFHCTAGLEIHPGSQPLDDEEEFKKVIESDKRILPVVVADHDVSDKLAASMAGLAHYWYSRQPGAFGARFDIADGAACVFWPKRALGQAQPTDVDHLPVLLAGASLLRGSARDANSWDALRCSKLQRRLGKLEKQARVADPNADMQDEVKKLNRKIREADKEDVRLKEELGTAQRSLGWFLRADNQLDALKRMGDCNGMSIETVVQAIDAARLDYESEIDFEHMVYRPEADQFDAPRHVFLALKWLARQYVVARRSGDRKDLPASCKDFCGFEYVPGQSKSTMGMYREDYQFNYRGQPVFAEEHLRWGVSRDPRQILRISFYYDKQENRVVLHYVGRHQRNQLT